MGPSRRQVQNLKLKTGKLVLLSYSLREEIVSQEKKG